MAEECRCPPGARAEWCRVHNPQLAIEMPPERDDSIHLDVLPKTFAALQALTERHEWRTLYRYIEPGELLLLIERLKRAQDAAHIFPHGKWATIQHLQTLFERGFWADQE